MRRKQILEEAVCVLKQEAHTFDPLTPFPVLLSLVRG